MDELRRNVNELAVVAAAIPEMRKDLKELVTSLRGENGNVGIVGRLSQVEQSLEESCVDYGIFKRQYNVDKKEQKDFINRKFDDLTQQFDRTNQERIEQHVKQLEKEKTAKEVDEKERRKDARNFRYAVAAIVITQVLGFLFGFLTLAN